MTGAEVPATGSGNTGEAPSGNGCSALLGLVLVVVAIVFINVGSGAKDVGSDYPEDGYTSFGELSGGLGWLLVLVAVAMFIGAARRNSAKDSQQAPNDPQRPANDDEGRP